MKGFAGAVRLVAISLLPSMTPIFSSPEQVGRMLKASKNSKTYLVGIREAQTLEVARRYCVDRGLHLPHMRELLDARDSGLLTDAHYREPRALLWSSNRMEGEQFLMYAVSGNLLRVKAGNRKAFFICVKRDPAQEARLREAAEIERLRERFPLWTIKNFRRVVARAPEYKVNIYVDARVPPLSVVVRATGQVREMPKPRRAKLEMLNQLPNFRRFVMQYTHEMEVEEQGRKYWLPIQPRHLARARELKPETELTVFMRQPGCCFTAPEMRIFLVINFTKEVKQRLPRMPCFAGGFLGAEVGGLVTDHLTALNKRFGPPRREFERGDLKYRLYIVDEKLGTAMYLADGGFRNRGRIYSIQVSGPPNPKLELLPGIRLGNAVDSMRAKLQLADKPEKSGEFEIWSMKDSSCSVQTLNGKLTSILIQADPNYFRD